MVEILVLPFLACLVLTAIHVYLGLHVLARGVIFVDLALAQVAALGMTVAILAGHAPASEGAYWYALAFAVGGAALLAFTRVREERVPREAIIGIVYVMSAALAVLVVDRAPQGAEHIKQLLVGSILAVDAAEVAWIAALYGGIGAILWKIHGPLFEISSGKTTGSVDVFGTKIAVNVLAWDFLFFLLFAVVVTSSVRIAGVLLVFSYLVVPAAIGLLLAASVRNRLLIGWLAGALVSAVGLVASWHLDLPTGAAVVATFGVAIALIGLVRSARRFRVRSLAIVVGIALAAAGALLAAVPRMDHLWLDALERAVPFVQTAFLTAAERDAYEDGVGSVARGEDELKRLRAMQDDARWGVRPMEEEKAERLRQYIAGRSEIVAGDRLSLRELRAAARERQRFILGLPLLAAGIAIAWLGYFGTNWPVRGST